MLTLKTYKAEMLSSVMLLLGIVLPYIGLGNEFIGRDEAYQALCVADYISSPVAMMAFYVGNLWTQVFGDDIMALRSLMVICYQLSIAISCLYLYYRTRHLLLSSTLFLTMCLGFRYVAMSLYGWDSGAYPAMTLFTVTMLVYIHRPSRFNVLLLGLATGLMAVTRIPTLAALPFILGVIVYKHHGDGVNSVRRIVSDSVIGLVSFAFSVFILVALMTSGNINVYIDAWVPDNIINGHFDREMLIWRWKDVTRRVVTAFYPMMLCFAAACYMVRVKRYSRLNAVICVLACAVTSFFFLKTYRLHYEYAAGIYESFFLLILFIPWLYNMTHSVSVRVPILPLFVITGCALLAGVGSDGFLERPMTVTTIPLLCIFIYDRFKNVMRWFLSFALISVAGMYLLMVVSNARHIEFGYDDKPHLSGIRGGKLDGAVVERFNQIAPVIESLKADGNKFACIGTDRYEYDYVFNDGVAYNLNHFHYFDREDDIAILKNVTEKYDNILMICRTDGAGYTESEMFLLSNGYCLAQKDFYYKLYRKPMEGHIGE